MKGFVTALSLANVMKHCSLIHDMYCDATEELTKESVIEAGQEEKISSIQEAEENGIEYEGIMMMSSDLTTHQPMRVTCIKMVY